jgi:hypothetical protein
MDSPTCHPGKVNATGESSMSTAASDGTNATSTPPLDPVLGRGDVDVVLWVRRRAIRVRSRIHRIDRIKPSSRPDLYRLPLYVQVVIPVIEPRRHEFVQG